MISIQVLLKRTEWIRKAEVRNGNENATRAERKCKSKLNLIKDEIEIFFIKSF